MKRDNDADEKFEWDMTAITLLVLVIVFLVVVAMSFLPLGHTT